MGNVVDKGTSFLFHVNRYVAGSETDMYKHGYAELLYVSDGSLTEHVCGDKVHIKKGDVCFINSGCVHKESFEEDDTFVIRLEVSDEIINAVISNAMADKQAVDYIKELVKVLKNSGYIHFGYKDDYDNELKDMLTAMISECGVADLYFSAGILDYLPLRIPVVGGRVSSPYGYRKDPLTGKGRFHAGLDYACELATTVHASAAGVVCFVGHRGGYGKCVEVKHRYGFSSIYAHLSGYYVRPGESIPAGKIIGFVGTTGRSTGYHLHYEVRKNNRVIKPLFIY